jgi:hypothetical protein
MILQSPTNSIGFGTRPEITPTACRTGCPEVARFPAQAGRHGRPPLLSLGPCDAVNDDRFVIVILRPVGQSFPILSAAFAPVSKIQPSHPLQQAA